MITENIDYIPSLFRYVTDPKITRQAVETPLTRSAVKDITTTTTTTNTTIIIITPPPPPPSPAPPPPQPSSSSSSS